MKLKMVVVDLNLSRREKRLAGAGLAACVLGAAAIAYAGPLKTWNQGDVLNASDLNGNFAQLASLQTELQGDEAFVIAENTKRMEAAGSVPMQGQNGTTVNMQSTQAVWQGGVAVVTTDGNGQATIGYQNAFPHGTLSVVLSNSDGQTFTPNPVSYTTTGFTVQVYNIESGAVASGVMAGINYVAIGW